MDFQGEALLLQRSLTVLSAGFNALYFFRYLGQMAGRSRDAGNKLAGGLVPLMVVRFDLGSGRQGLELIAGLLSLASASAMTTLVLRVKRSRQD